jgi:nucleotidyltransferase substrate binding protein (TIGR01987 family)
MTKEKLIITPFKKAVMALQNALAQPKNEFTRDACIQRFEYTFELSWKMLKRHLSMEAGVEEYSIKNLFRAADKAHLIDNLERWFRYLEVRNLTSHTYNEKVAEEAYSAAKQFADDANTLLSRLEIFYANSAE